VDVELSPASRRAGEAAGGLAVRLGDESGGHLVARERETLPGYAGEEVVEVPDGDPTRRPPKTLTMQNAAL